VEASRRQLAKGSLAAGIDDGGRRAVMVWIHGGKRETMILDAALHIENDPPAKDRALRLRPLQPTSEPKGTRP
jgi:hypothetical protein